MSDPMSDAMSVTRDSPKRWQIALVCVMAVTAWASVVFWQHEGRAADAAANKDAAAHDVYRHAQAGTRAAQARLAQAHEVIDSVVPTIDRDTDVTDLGNSLDDLHRDVAAQVDFYARMIDALARHDFTTYNALLGPLSATVAPEAVHDAEEARLHARLGLKLCDGCP